jgi:hypothetical protein
MVLSRRRPPPPAERTARSTPFWRSRTCCPLPAYYLASNALKPKRNIRSEFALLAMLTLDAIRSAVEYRQHAGRSPQFPGAYCRVHAAGRLPRGLCRLRILPTASALEDGDFRRNAHPDVDLAFDRIVPSLPNSRVWG